MVDTRRVILTGLKRVSLIVLYSKRAWKSRLQGAGGIMTAKLSGEAIKTRLLIPL